MQTGCSRICKFGKSDSDDYFKNEQHSENLEKITAKQRQETNIVVRKKTTIGKESSLGRKWM